MPIAKIEKQQAIGALKATGSSDPDVLFARKEELLTDTRKLRLLGVFPIIVGVVATLTVVGAVVGIPAILFGLWVRRRIRHNVTTVDAAYAEYRASILGPAHAAGV